MTLFDYGVIAVISISLLMGAWRGVVGEIIAIVAWVVAFLVAQNFSFLAENLFFGHITDPEVRSLLAWIVVFIIVLILMALVRMAASSTVHNLGLGVSDRFLGLIFGFARGLFLIVILVAMGGMTSLPKQPWWFKAQLAPPLETLVLASKDKLPDEIAKRIQFR